MDKPTHTIVSDAKTLKDLMRMPAEMQKWLHDIACWERASSRMKYVLGVPMQEQPDEYLAHNRAVVDEMHAEQDGFEPD